MRRAKARRQAKEEEELPPRGGKGDSNGKGKGFQGACYKCGQAGHRQSECWVGRGNRLTYNVEEEEYEEADDEEKEIGGVWLIADVDTKPVKIAPRRSQRSCCLTFPAWQKVAWEAWQWPWGVPQHAGTAGTRCAATRTRSFRRPRMHRSKCHQWHTHLDRAAPHARGPLAPAYGPQHSKPMHCSAFGHAPHRG